MFLKLLLIFIVVPLLELMVIIEVSSRIGLFYTLITLVLISITGAALAKQQGYQTLERVRLELRAGRMPGDSLIDGAMVLSGALMLLTPGYITDMAGLLLLIPAVRKPVRAYVKRRLERAVARRTVRIFTPGDSYQPEQRRKELDP